MHWTRYQRVAIWTMDFAATLYILKFDHESTTAEEALKSTLTNCSATSNLKHQYQHKPKSRDIIPNTCLNTCL